MRTHHARRFLRCVVAGAALAMLAGCAATRYDTNGRPIYFLQFGQQWDNAVDYSNPRLPILPRGRPVDPLWDPPSTYEFNDLSRYSRLEVLPLETLIAQVGDNPGCAASCASNANGLRLVARADLRDIGRVSVIR